jgi:sugar phosphate isomerase/epimerase
MAATGMAMLNTATIHAADANRKMTLNLVCGAIGVSADQKTAIDHAHRYGFESVEAIPYELVRMSPSELNALTASLKAKGLVWGSAGLPVDFRKDEAGFRSDLEKLDAQAAALKAVGVDRMNTWLMPSHKELTYTQNFHLHARRLAAIGKVLKPHGIRLGLEYVGTTTLLIRSRYPFVHTMAETLELIDATGADNIGLVLDSWHWWQAGDSADDIRNLKNEQVILVDLNDAPAGVEKTRQSDGRRELPLATGVIDVVPFLKALNAIGYDGPVRAEPFNKPLRDMNDANALKATATSLKKAFALL